MDAEDFADWQLCWRVNLHFFKPVTKSLKCVPCSKSFNYAVGDAQRSSFWVDGTRCSVGHRQMTQIESQADPSLGICATCDQMYMLDLLKGKYTCRREGCRRTVRVHEAEVVKQMLACDQVLLKDFLALVKKHTVYECTIHGDEVEYETNPLNPVQTFKPPTPQCDHDRNVCDSCLSLTFESAIRSGRLQDLVCPDLECRKPISLDVIRSNSSADVFKIYNKQLALKAISKDEKFRWCTCGHGQIHGPGENNPEWNCLHCSKRHCYICKEQPSDTCDHLRVIDEQKHAKTNNQKKSAFRILSESAKKAEDARRRARQNEAGTEREKARTTKRCPKAGCCNRIERNGGCGHFKCGMCKTEFCWCCKVIWKNDSSPQHLVGCRIGTKTQLQKSSLNQTGYAVGWDKDEGYDLTLDEGLWLLSAHM